MKYNCPRCGYGCNKKSCMVNHLNRKTLCRNVLDDVLPNSMSCLILDGRMGESEINALLDKSYVESLRVKDKKIQEGESRMVELENRISELNRVIKKLGKENVKLEDKVSSVEDRLRKVKDLYKIKLEDAAKGLDNRVDVLGKVVLNRWDKPEVDLLANDYSKCINHMAYGVVDFIELVYYNRVNTKNFSIYSNCKTARFIDVYDGSRWITLKGVDVINKLIEVSSVELCVWANKNSSVCERFLSNFDNFLDVNRDDIRESIRLVLYNNRKLVSKRGMN